MITFFTELGNVFLFGIAVFFMFCSLLLLIFLRKKALQNSKYLEKLDSLNQGIAEVLKTVNDGFIFFKSLTF